MGSQDSNIGSDGIPFDHEGAPLEYGLFNGHEMPFVVSGSVLRELVSGQGREEAAQHLEIDPVRDEVNVGVVDVGHNKEHMSSSGGIMVE